MTTAKIDNSFFYDAVQPTLWGDEPATLGTPPVINTSITPYRAETTIRTVVTDHVAFEMDNIPPKRPLPTAPILSFLLKGLPAPQGSKVVFNGHAVESNKRTRPWRALLTDAVEQAIEAQNWTTIPKGVPVEVIVTFFKPRPKAHYRTGKNAHLLRDDAPYYVANGPDIDKLERALLDGMKVAGVYADDKQVARIVPTHIWTSQGHPFAVGGVEVYVQALSAPSNLQ